MIPDNGVDYDKVDLNVEDREKKNEEEDKLEVSDEDVNGKNED